MTERDALIAAVIADPDDDTPRLVFADWLDEHGEPHRGEFVRLQVELENTPAGGSLTGRCTYCDTTGQCGCDCRHCVLRRREVELWNAREGWFPKEIDDLTLLPLRGWLPNRTLGLVRRGFVSAVHLPAAGWLAHADALLAAHPVTEVTLTTRPMGGDLWRRTDDEVKDWMSGHWPRVRTWHLPEPEPTYRVFGRVQLHRVEGEANAVALHLGDGEFEVVSHDPLTNTVTVRARTEPAPLSERPNP